MNYRDLKFNKKPGGLGSFARHTFDNGYTASVITDGYGEERGLLEVAVLWGGDLCYDTPITDDVLGSLTHSEVEDVLDRIAALPPREASLDGAA